MDSLEPTSESLADHAAEVTSEGQTQARDHNAPTDIEPPGTILATPGAEALSGQDTVATDVETQGISQASSEREQAQTSRHDSIPTQKTPGSTTEAKHGESPASTEAHYRPESILEAETQPGNDGAPTDIQARRRGQPIRRNPGGSASTFPEDPSEPFGQQVTVEDYEYPSPRAPMIVNIPGALEDSIDADESLSQLEDSIDEDESRSQSESLDANDTAPALQTIAEEDPVDEEEEQADGDGQADAPRSSAQYLPPVDHPSRLSTQPESPADPQLSPAPDGKVDDPQDLNTDGIDTSHDVEAVWSDDDDPPGPYSRSRTPERQTNQGEPETRALSFDYIKPKFPTPYRLDRYTGNFRRPLPSPRRERPDDEDAMTTALNNNLAASSKRLKTHHEYTVYRSQPLRHPRFSAPTDTDANESVELYIKEKQYEHVAEHYRYLTQLYFALKKTKAVGIEGKLNAAEAQHRAEAASKRVQATRDQLKAERDQLRNLLYGKHLQDFSSVTEGSGWKLLKKQDHKLVSKKHRSDSEAAATQPDVDEDTDVEEDEGSQDESPAFSTTAKDSKKAEKQRKKKIKKKEALKRAKAAKRAQDSLTDADSKASSEPPASQCSTETQRPTLANVPVATSDSKSDEQDQRTEAQSEHTPIQSPHSSGAESGLIHHQKSHTDVQNADLPGNAGKVQRQENQPQVHRDEAPGKRAAMSDQQTETPDPQQKTSDKHTMAPAQRAQAPEQPAANQHRQAKAPGKLAKGPEQTAGAHELRVTARDQLVQSQEQQTEAEEMSSEDDDQHCGPAGGLVGSQNKGTHDSDSPVAAAHQKGPKRLNKYEALSSLVEAAGSEGSATIRPNATPRSKSLSASRKFPNSTSDSVAPELSLAQNQTAAGCSSPKNGKSEPSLPPPNSSSSKSLTGSNRKEGPVLRTLGRDTEVGAGQTKLSVEDLNAKQGGVVPRCEPFDDASFEIPRAHRKKNKGKEKQASEIVRRKEATSSDLSSPEMSTNTSSSSSNSAASPDTPLTPACDSLVENNLSSTFSDDALAMQRIQSMLKKESSKFLASVRDIQPTGVIGLGKEEASATPVGVLAKGSEEAPKKLVICSNEVQAESVSETKHAGVSTGVDGLPIRQEETTTALKSPIAQVDLPTEGGTLAAPKHAHREVQTDPVTVRRVRNGPNANVNASGHFTARRAPNVVCYVPSQMHAYHYLAQHLRVEDVLPVRHASESNAHKEGAPQGHQERPVQTSSPTHQPHKHSPTRFDGMSGLCTQMAVAADSAPSSSSSSEQPVGILERIPDPSPVKAAGESSTPGAASNHKQSSTMPEPESGSTQTADAAGSRSGASSTYTAQTPPRQPTPDPNVGSQSSTNSPSQVPGQPPWMLDGADGNRFASGPVGAPDPVNHVNDVPDQGEAESLMHASGNRPPWNTNDPHLGSASHVSVQETMPSLRFHPRWTIQFTVPAGSSVDLEFSPTPLAGVQYVSSHRVTIYHMQYSTDAQYPVQSMSPPPSPEPRWTIQFTVPVASMVKLEFPTDPLAGIRNFMPPGYKVHHVQYWPADEYPVQWIPPPPNPNPQYFGGVLQPLVQSMQSYLDANSAQAEYAPPLDVQDSQGGSLPPAPQTPVPSPPATPLPTITFSSPPNDPASSSGTDHATDTKPPAGPSNLLTIPQKHPRRRRKSCPEPRRTVDGKDKDVQPPIEESEPDPQHVEYCQPTYGKVRILKHRAEAKEKASQEAEEQAQETPEMQGLEVTQKQAPERAEKQGAREAEELLAQGIKNNDAQEAEKSVPKEAEEQDAEHGQKQAESVGEPPSTPRSRRRIVEDGVRPAGPDSTRAEWDVRYMKFDKNGSVIAPENERGRSRLDSDDVFGMIEEIAPWAFQKPGEGRRGG